MLKNKLKIVIASHNQHKLVEILAITNKHPQGDFILQNIDFVLATDFNLDAPEENGQTFLDNAIIKAKFSSDSTNLIAMSDDSGICIKALNNDPGIYSARWIEENGEEATFNKIQQLIENNSDKSAYFYCEMCLYFPQLIAKELNIPSQYKNFVGTLDGTISSKALGDKGFAYDKIFIANKYSDSKDNNKTLAQIDSSNKNAISHRNMALNKLLDYLITIIPLLKSYNLKAESEK